MKKILFILFIIVGFKTVAQCDTLYLNRQDRDLRYYYWDSLWADVWNPNSNVSQTWSDTYKSIVARPCYTASGLTVIGIAGISYQYKEWGACDTIEAHREPEYFILYESTDTSFVMLDSARYDHRTTVHKYYISDRYNPKFYDIKEVYFNKPYPVKDTFYVAGTHNNNYYLWEGGRNLGRAHYPTAYLGLMAGYAPPFTNPISYYKSRALIPARMSFNLGFDSSAMEWHYYHHQGEYLCIWPILDTTGMGLWNPPTDTTAVDDDSCYQVQGLQVIGVEYGMATLTWQVAHGQSQWELAYGASGTPPDSCQQLQTGSQFVTLPNLDTGTWYVAYVRADCDTLGYSDWSDSVRFHGSGNIAIATPVSEYTHLYPNPAQDRLNITSSFRIAHVEVYDLQGRQVLQQPVDALFTEINIASLSKGQYIVLIHTPAGTAIKKLIRR